MTAMAERARDETGAQGIRPEARFLGLPMVSNAAAGYRRDIDGLRAIAVAVVVIFHTGVSPLRGGFIGVDIFFVISGFLISGLLIRDIDRGSFSLSRFYERRLRRILPAMLAMVAVVLALSPILLFSPELRITALTALSSLFSAANLYLLSTAGYFEADSLTQPLLHLWSLGVEEQFYVLFPIALILLAAVGRRWLPLGVILLTAASLAACIIVTRLDRDFAYFFPLTRAWELMIGALLVLVPLPRVPRLLRELAALVAVAIILGSAWRFHSGMAFPGWVALIPCLAAAGLIAVGSQGGSLVTQALSWRPVVFVGQISYSLYLWHWPVFVAYRLVNGGAIGRLEAILLVIVSIGIACLSWRYVERPFREKAFLPTQRSVFTAAAVGSLILAITAGVTFQIAQPTATPRDEADRLSRYIAYDDTPVYRRGVCFLLGHINRLEDFKADICLTPSTVKPNVLLMGDSHGAHLWSGLDQVLPEAHVMQATSTGCKPVIETQGEVTCRLLAASTFERIGQDLRPDLLVLSARWEASDMPALRRTIETLRPKVGRLLVSGPIVEYGVALPRLLAQIAEGRDPALFISARVTKTRALDAELRALVEAAGADYASPYSVLCPASGEACTTQTAQGVPIQWDYGHLTREGSGYVANAVKDAGLLQLPAAP